MKEAKLTNKTIAQTTILHQTATKRLPTREQEILEEAIVSSGPEVLKILKETLKMQ